jgi:transposase-like protein
MYSYEERIRAVRLYIKLGKRVAKTIRQLGYPTKNALKSWHREYERCHDLRAIYTRSKPKYSEAQKKLAVDHYLSHGCCIAASIRALGYPGRAWLSAWIHELHPEMRKRVIGTAAGQPRSPALKQAAVIALCTR